MRDDLRSIRDTLTGAALCFLMGAFTVYLIVAQPAVTPTPTHPPAPTPITRPAPSPAPAPVHHSGHFTVSYVEPRYGSPSSAAVRDALAGVDWHALDATFRSYTVGQAELTTLGLDKHFDPDDLPIALIQETGPKGAPIIATVAGPASVNDVLGTVRGLRGN